MDNTAILDLIIKAGGGTGLLMSVLWNLSLRKDKEELRSDLKETLAHLSNERQKTQELGESILVLATEMKLHIVNIPTSAEKVVAKIESEHVLTRKLISHE